MATKKKKEPEYVVACPCGNRKGLQVRYVISTSGAYCPECGEWFDECDVIWPASEAPKDTSHEEEAANG
jgi:hypothetical protein